MSEAAGDGRQEMERRIVQKSLEDEGFRQKLLNDPKAAVEEELGAPLPEGVEIRAVEETADTVFLVLPPSGSSAGGDNEEISDQDLDAVAGGAGDRPTENTCVGPNCGGGGW